jgi:hypothetical protein
MLGSFTDIAPELDDAPGPGGGLTADSICLRTTVRRAGAGE